MDTLIFVFIEVFVYAYANKRITKPEEKLH